MLQMIDVPESVVDEAVQALAQNQPISFWSRHGERYPLRQWAHGKPATVAARMLGRLGDLRGQGLLQLRNHRACPEDTHAGLYHLYHIMQGSGMLRTYERIDGFLQSHGPLMPPKIKADTLDLRAYCRAFFRDRDGAFADLDEAEALCPGRAWIQHGRASVMQVLDMREQALECILELLSREPHYRPARLKEADLLVELGRLDEAVERLINAHEGSELADYAMRLSAIASDRDDVQAAGHWLDQLASRWPLADRDMKRWEARRRAGLAIVSGRIEDARKWIARSKSPYHDSLLESLSRIEAAEGRRVRLDVGFVCQNHMTCAPATLASLAAYWKRPFNHLEIAEQICYDGTPSYSQRRWAIENGFHARHFRVDMRVSVALIDAGVPFCLTTVGTTWSHLQAVIGYDERAGILIVRDPTHAHYTELSMGQIAKDMAASGPLGLVFLPEEQKHRLEGIELPEAGLLDLQNALQEALQDHRRDEARALCDRLNATHADHRVTWLANWMVAAYDGNATLVHKAIEVLHRHYPESDPVALKYFSSLKETASHAELVEWLGKRTAGRDCDIAFLRELALLQRDNGPEWPDAHRTLGRILRLSPRDGHALNVLASLCWSEGNRQRALLIYRFAAMSEDKNEWHARCYFNALRWMGHRQQAVDFLKRRFDELGAVNPGPAVTLVECLDEIDQDVEADEVLELARGRCGTKGELDLLAVSRLLDRGELGAAAALLDEVRSHCQKSAWLRKAATIARLESDYQREIQLWNEVLENEPLAMDAHAARIFALAASRSESEALDELARVRGRFPTHGGLAELHVNWLRDGGSAEIFRVLDELVALQPLNDWAWRELAIAHLGRRQLDQARKAALRALEVAPGQSYSYSVMGDVCMAEERRAEAADHFRSSLSRLVDNAHAINALVDCADDVAGRRAAIHHVLEEMKRQVISGDSIRAFQRVAYPHIEPGELLGYLQEIHEARPDLPLSWSMLVEQFIAMQQTQDAHRIALEFTVRYPYLGDAWYTLAAACRSKMDIAGEISALEQALRLHPRWGAALRGLMTAYEEEGRFDDAIRIGRRAVTANPLEPSNHGVLADLLWRQGEREQAIRCVERSVELEPGYQWAWGRLDEWGRETGRPDLLLEAARVVCERRPHEPRSWLLQAETLDKRGRSGEALEVVMDGLRQVPRNVSLHDRRIQLLLQLKGFDAAFEACTPEAFHGDAPVPLLGRRAWLIAMTGNLQGAAKEMAKILEKDPSYLWGTIQQVEWLRRLDRHDEAITVARQLVRLQPDDAVAHGYLASELFSAKRNEEAIRAVGKAFALDPSYHFAACRLFDAQLNGNDLDGASRTAARFARHAPGSVAQVMEARIAKARGDRAAYREAIIRLMTLADAGEDDIESLQGESVASQPWAKIWKQEMDRIVRVDRRANPATAAVWSRHFKPRFPLTVVSPLDTIINSGLPTASRNAAIISWLWARRDTISADRMQAIIRSRSALLRSDVELWASAGSLLHALGLYRETSRWMEDWATRPGIKPQMLVALAHAMDVVEGPAAAVAVRRRMMEMEGFPDRFLHEVGLALGLALAGELEEAKDWISHVDGEGLPAYYGVMHAMTLALIEAHAEPVDPSKVCGHVTQAAKAWPKWRQDSALNKVWPRFMAGLKRIAALKPAWRGIETAVNRHSEKSSVMTFQHAVWIALAVAVWVVVVLPKGCTGS